MADGKNINMNISKRKKYIPITYSGNSPLTTANISMTIGNQPILLEIPLPTEKVTAETMLPLFQGLTNFLVEVSVEAAEKEGRQVSCKKGCGACCNQLVPITALEANYLKKMLSKLPSARQAAIQEKFEQATQSLATANILEKLSRPQSLNKEQRIKLGLDYFQLGIPCPFLEDESCSIHTHRPMACREYLVTSPVKHCSTPELGEIEGIKIPRKVSQAVTQLTKKKKAPKGRSWIPLILTIEYQHLAEGKPKLQTGVEWLQELFARL